MTSIPLFNTICHKGAPTSFAYSTRQTGPKIIIWIIHRSTHHSKKKLSIMNENIRRHLTTLTAP